MRSVGKNVEKLETLAHCCQESSFFGRVWQFLEGLNRAFLHDRRFTPGHAYSREVRVCPQKGLSTNDHSNITPRNSKVEIAQIPIN
jgi:hypothetical protein